MPPMSALYYDRSGMLAGFEAQADAEADMLRLLTMMYPEMLVTA
jgi:hypothetical protein